MLFAGRFIKPASIFLKRFSMDGYVKIYKKLLDWKWYSSTPHTRIFLHLLLTVSHADNYCFDVLVKRGEVLTSLASLREKTNLTGEQVRDVISDLVNSKEITIRNSIDYSIITIVNWECYQLSEKKKITKIVTKNNNVKKVDVNEVPIKVYGEFNNINLSDKELDKLVAKFGEQGTNDWIEEISFGVATHGYKYKSHYAAILNWSRKRNKENEQIIFPRKRQEKKNSLQQDLEGQDLETLIEKLARAK